MTCVYLLTESPDLDQTHWGNSFNHLKMAFESSHSRRHILVSSPDRADLIIVCGCVRNTIFPLKLINHPVIRAYKEKCIWFSTEDGALPFLPGFYTSLSRRQFTQKYYQGAFYLHVTRGKLFEAFSLDGPFKYLFSFVGNIKTHKVRQHIAKLSHDRAMLRNTDKDPGNLSNQDPKTYLDFEASFNDSLMTSKFILCPRGMCFSSIRLFEVMKAGRVPVVISDEWMRPPHIPWDDFCIFVKEKDCHKIPNILENVEDEFRDRAIAARKYWERYFSKENLADTVTDWSLELLEEKRSHNTWFSGILFSLFWKKLLNWQFYRRGLAPEIKYWFKNKLGKPMRGD